MLVKLPGVPMARKPSTNKKHLLYSRRMGTGQPRSRFVAGKSGPSLSVPKRTTAARTVSVTTTPGAVAPSITTRPRVEKTDVTQLPGAPSPDAGVLPGAPPPATSPVTVTSGGFSSVHTPAGPSLEKLLRDHRAADQSLAEAERVADEFSNSVESGISKKTLIIGGAIALGALLLLRRS